MTAVHVDLRKPQPGTTSRLPVDGSLIVSLYRRQVEGTEVTLVTTFQQVLVNGQATLQLTPTTGYNAWVIQEKVRDGITRIVAVPDSSTTVEYVNLSDLTPGSLSPDPNIALSAWAAVAATATAARDAAVAARNGMVTGIAIDATTGVLTLTKQDGTTSSGGTALVPPTGDTRYTQRSLNLSDLPNATTARANLGLTPILAAKADLVGGVVPTSQIPALALANTQVVASQAAMLALTSSQVQPGDLAIRTDGAGTFILTATDPSVLGNWQRLNAPTDVVVSVNGQQGTVVLAKADVGLGNVDNTSDVNKPVSTAQQTALNLKAPLASPALTGTPTTPTAAVGTNTTQIASTAFVLAATPDASGTTKGLVQLAGDLTGTAASPALAAVGSAGTYGSASQMPVFTTDSKGRITGVNPTGIVIAESAVTGLVADLSAKAPLLSPVFTGTPTAPNPTSNDYSQQVPTTKFVWDTIAVAQGFLAAVNPRTASYTLAAGDPGKMVTMQSSSATTITVPTNASVPIGVGAVVPIANLGTGALSIAGASGVTVSSPAGLRITAQYGQASLVKVATDTWLLSGQTVT